MQRCLWLVAAAPMVLRCLLQDSQAELHLLVQQPPARARTGTLSPADNVCQLPAPGGGLEACEHGIADAPRRSSDIDAGLDGPVDASADASVDATVDATVDAPVDAMVDATPLARPA